MPATAKKTETDFSHEDVQEMGLEELLETEPSDTAAVQAIGDRIDELEGRLEDAQPDDAPVEEAQGHVDAAKENLQETRTAYELGEADAEDVETAEAAVKAAQEELEEAKAEAEAEAMPGYRREAIENALDRLTEEREAAVESAREALQARAQAIRDRLAREAHEAYAQAIERTHELKELRLHANHKIGNGRKSVLSNARAIPQRLEPYDRGTMDILNQGAELFGADVEGTLESIQ